MDRKEVLSMEEKWQKKWEEERIFQASPEKGMRKYFANIPYPYVNGYLHLGFAVTFLHGDVMARYKRMRGYNVLFPQAFHCTGFPIVAAAKRINEGEEIQTKIMRDMGIPENEISKFGDPIYWTRFFPPEAKKDLMRLGASVDWRRTFITTYLNPHYDKFVKWQFRKLKERGYLELGEHPVIWCPKDQSPVGDHDRLEGEGEVPVEFILLKFPIEDKFLVAATLRPETVFGQTNLWIDPNVVYVEASVDGEKWILNRECAEKLTQQKKEVTIIAEIDAKDLIGRTCTAPFIHKHIPILPSRFIDQDKGTGIVTSVPSDAPDDWVALRDLQRDENVMKEFSLEVETIRSIKPVSIINSEGWGPLPAVEIVEKMGIDSQMEREKLEKAKEEIYRTGYYTGVMNESCGDFAGQKVEVAKELIKQRMIEDGEADIMYEPGGEVICRCLTKAIVKIVSNQWFLKYGDGKWKERTSRALERLTLIPEISRKQFEYVIDWLRDWACSHHFGLGSTLPWDEEWVIESLSDSTIYMAYYTISHYLSDGRIDAKKIDDSFFDLIFLGDGEISEVSKKCSIEAKLLEEMRREFLYWYPFDLRNSGKDLVQNHLAFCLFNHVALFPDKHWPRAFGINGFVKLEGQRMSKSHGIVTYIRDAIDAWGADVTRITLLQGGEGMDDPTFDGVFADGIGRKLHQWMEFATKEHHSRTERLPIDDWFDSVMNLAIVRCSEAMESLKHRTALKHGFFDLQREWNWYLRRCSNLPQEDILRNFIEIQTKLLAPFVPHICEEIWSRIGGNGFISLSQYPEAKREIDIGVLSAEEYFRKTMDDIRQIMRATKMRPSKIFLYTYPRWMAPIYSKGIEKIKRKKLQMGSFMKEVMRMEGMRSRAQRVSRFAKDIVEIIEKMRPEDIQRFGKTIDEQAYLSASKDFLRREFGCPVEVFRAEDQGVYDPQGRGERAIPWRPAIYVE